MLSIGTLECGFFHIHESLCRVSSLDTYKSDAALSTSYVIMLSVFIHLTLSSFWKNLASKFSMRDCLVAVLESAMRIFHCALTCRRWGHFFYRAEKWYTRMKVEAKIPQPEREWRASLGMTRLMQSILLGGKILAYIPEGLRLTLWLENTTVPCTLRGYLNWHIGSLPGILQHIRERKAFPF